MLKRCFSQPIQCHLNVMLTSQFDFFSCQIDKLIPVIRLCYLGIDTFKGFNCWSNIVCLKDCVWRRINVILTSWFSLWFVWSSSAQLVIILKKHFVFIRICLLPVHPWLKCCHFCIHSEMVHLSTSITVAPACDSS